VICVTQLIYVHAGEEAAFETFEAAVLPLLARHGGELVLRLRPEAASVVSAAIEVPYEVHVVRFADDAALAAYSADPARQAWLPERRRAVRATLTVIGQPDGDWLPLSV